MGKIYNSIIELVGHTPIVRLNNIEKQYNTFGELYAKIEYFNPASSAKDRVAAEMIADAERKGILKKDTIIIEPTSGNTGIGLSAVCAAKGYHLIIVMPDSMSMERQLLMKAYGAELVLTDGNLGMKGAIEKAEELKNEYPGSVIAGQFVNPANPEAHRKTTGPEIYEDMDGNVDIFVSTVGTGGTITGTGEFLKSKIEKLKVIAVEPFGSPYLSKQVSGKHLIQGIGAGFVPEVLNTSVYDEICTVTDKEAYDYAGVIVRTEGIFVGISSGAALCCAIKEAQKPENKGKKIVVMLPDSGERYLSTPDFI